MGFAGLLWTQKPGRLHLCKLRIYPSVHRILKNYPTSTLIFYAHERLFLTNSVLLLFFGIVFHSIFFSVLINRAFRWWVINSRLEMAVRYLLCTVISNMFVLCADQHIIFGFYTVWYLFQYISVIETLLKSIMSW